MPRAFGAPGGDVQDMYDTHGWFQYSTSDPRLIETRVKRALKRGYWFGGAPMPLHLGVKLINSRRSDAARAVPCSGPGCSHFEAGCAVGRAPWLRTPAS